MRLYFDPLAVSAVPFRPGEAAVAGPLVTAARLTLRLPPSLPRTALGTIPMTAVTMAADQNLGPTAGTQEEPAGLVGTDTAKPKWTHRFLGAILRLHSCSCTV